MENTTDGITRKKQMSKTGSKRGQLGFQQPRREIKKWIDEEGRDTNDMNEPF